MMMRPIQCELVKIKAAKYIEHACQVYKGKESTVVGRGKIRSWCRDNPQLISHVMAYLVEQGLAEPFYPDEDPPNAYKIYIQRMEKYLKEKAKEAGNKSG
jgi:hypothetical protein